MSNAVPVPDRRKYDRKRVSKSGRIFSSEPECLIEVEIYDMSVAGARIRAAANIEIPVSFDLIVVSESIHYPAIARWRNGEWVGVSFQGAPYHLPAGV